MKVTAYLTDCCNKLLPAKDVVGLSIEQDLHDKYKSYPTVPNPEKADIHYCLNCYGKYVISTASSLVNRKDNEAEYIYLLKIHGHLFKEMVIKSYNRRTYNQKKEEKR